MTKTMKSIQSTSCKTRFCGYLRKGLLICMLVAVVLLLRPQQVYATTIGALDSSSDAGTTEDRTNIREPGTAETPDDLKELNIANDLTVTYNDGNGTIAGALRLMLNLTGITVAPILLICLTSFTRILIVLHFTRSALNTQTAPPNQILIALSLFLTFFIMNPVITQINDNEIKPMEAEEITQEVALERGIQPLREFMYGQTQTKDAKTFCDIGGYEWTGDLDDIPTSALIPAFMVSELRTAFIIGFVIYIPFIVIDMVVASALMSMGMMMLPPTTISMPFKILLFVLADGWNLVIVNLVRTFY